MSADPGESRDDPADAARMSEISAQLVAAAERALGPWVEAAVERFDPAGHLTEEARRAGVRAGAELGARLRELADVDIDAQRTTPLAILRGAYRYPGAVLAAAGVPSPERDPFDAARDPDDRYGLAPTAWADLGDEVGRLGLEWGAAKAHLHLRRRRRAG